MVTINLSNINRIRIEQGNGSTTIIFSGWRGSDTTITMDTFDANLLTEKLNEVSGDIEYKEHRAKMKEYGCDKLTVLLEVWKAHREFEAMTNKIREAKG